MNAQKTMSRERTRPTDIGASPHPSYLVTFTETGKWLHAPGSDFLFAYLEESWPAEVKNDVTKAFENALSLSTTIKESVKETSGEDVVQGLYLLDQDAMIKAMNTIEGMGQTGASRHHEAGSGTAVSINGDFFASILGGLGGDIGPIMEYLTKQMGDVQAQTKKSTVTQDFGTVIGLISVMPVLNVPVVSFQYAFSSSETSDWFVKINCASVEKHAYDYSYTAVAFNYSAPSGKD